MAEQGRKVIRWVTIRGKRVPITATPRTARQGRRPASREEALRDAASAIIEALSAAAQRLAEEGRHDAAPYAHIADVARLLRRKWSCTEEQALRALELLARDLFPGLRGVISFGPSREPPNLRVPGGSVGHVAARAPAGSLLGIGRERE